MAGSYRRVYPIEAEVLRAARGVEQPLSEDCACVFADPDVYCAPPSYCIIMQVTTRAQGAGGGENHAVWCDAPPPVALCRRKHDCRLCPRGRGAWLHLIVGHGPYYCTLLPKGARAHLL